MPFATRYSPDTLAPDIYATLRKMQKFMVVKKYNVDRPEIPPEPAKVKMSGYLKKKRSKMGGWRKMWFVLQNHLLLSYPTKEEYDKGLGTFKDVLNLVPGTQIRPLGGFRFTIETTTNTIYTFRCDDSKTCTEWITALLESLSIKPDPKPKDTTIVEKIPKFHTSLNDISEVERTDTIRTSASCDSIYQVKNDTLSPKSPKILIAQNTARILERNGVATKKMNKLQQIEEEAESPKRSRNFRLHERSYSANQSDEVSRINQMFRRSISTSVLNHRRTGSDSRSGGGSRSSSSASSSPFDEPMTRSGSQVISSTLLVKQLQEHYKRIKNVNDASATSSTTTTTNTASSENNSVNSESRRYKCKHCTSKGKGHKRDYNQNNMIADCERTLEDDVQRLSLNDKSAYDPTVLHNGDTNAANILKDPPTSSPRRRRRQCTNHSPLHHHQSHHCRRHHSEGIDAGLLDGDMGADADNEDADGDGNGAVLALNGDVQDQRMSTTPRLSLSSDNVNMLEPIYAVVDLKNKYAHRAKMRQLEEQMERERPKSVHVASSDYEEVLNFSHESEEDEDSENIYEPINIPETIQQRTTVWKYFPKFNIETLMEMARTRKKVAPGPEFVSHQNNGSYHGLNPSHFVYPLQSTASYHNNNHNNHSPHHSTTFSDIRKKFGYHRKSIKNRMRRFYWKDSSNATTSNSSTSSSTGGQGRFFLPPLKIERNAYSDDELDSQGATTVSNSETSEGSFKLQFDHCSRDESDKMKMSKQSKNNNNRSCNNSQSKVDKAAPYVLNEIEKCRRGERHFFGSLSRLRKTRTSLCLDDDNTNSIKKKIAALAAPKSSPCFQHELRNELLRRSGRKLDN